MIAAVIRWSARNLFLVLLATVFVTLAGIYAVSRVPLDAIPDLSDVQVIVYTEYPGQAPQVVEDQVTYPLTTAMLSVPKSQSGARLLVLRRVVRLRDLRGRHRPLLGALARARIPQLGRAAGCPPASRRRSGRTRPASAGSTSTSCAARRRTLAELRTLQDWYIRYGLAKARGRRRGRERRRLRQAVQRGGRSAPAAALGIPLVEGPRGDPRRATATSAAASSSWPRPSSWCAGAATSRASSDLEQIVVKSDQRRAGAAPRRGARRARRRTSGAASPS